VDGAVVQGDLRLRSTAGVGQGCALAVSDQACGAYEKSVWSAPQLVADSLVAL